MEKELVFHTGDYIAFGRYYNVPILWRCVTKDYTGPLLVSEYILCLKAFDAAESGKCEYGKNDVDKYGSNDWEKSNLREWLNSQDDMVEYTTQSPTKSAVYSDNVVWADDPVKEKGIYTGFNAYVNEPGFLANFDWDERNKINPVVHDGVKDRVFLLSEEEIERFWKSYTERLRYPTRLAVENSDYKKDLLKDDESWYYWTRTPRGDSGCFVSRVFYRGYFYVDFAYYGYVGVLPALYLKSDIYQSGKGSKEEPYTI